jgi:hypothetical protein
VLIENERHKKFHESGPKDLKKGERNEKGELKDAIATFQVTRSTIDNEQMSVSIPVFESDSREDLDLRVGMLMSIMQDRIEDAAKAWQKSADEALAAEREARLENLKDARGKKRNK